MQIIHLVHIHNREEVLCRLGIVRTNSDVVTNRAHSGATELEALEVVY